MNLVLLLFCTGILGAPAASPPGQEGLQPGPDSYRLLANDIVEIKVYQEDDLTTKARIGREGTISFPLIGLVRVAGKTTQEAAEIIRVALQKDYLVNPQVTLIVAEYSKRRFSVLGQAQKPGSFEFPGEESVTLLQAIAMAGGFTRLADQAHLKVTRTVNGTVGTLTLDARRQMNNDDPPFNLKPDDILTIPERLF